MARLGLNPDVVTQLPVDELALQVLRDLERMNERSTFNYIAWAKEDRYPVPALRAIDEALEWLRASGLLAHDNSQTSAQAVFITRLGKRILSEGVRVLHATERTQGVHASIEAVARAQFLLGQFELGVFASLKAVEVRVRQLAGFPQETIGVDLMNRAFGPSGPLTDMSVAKGEQEGTRALFAGAYGVLRNPSAHREVNYDDVSEAAEAVQTASLLMRILDRVEKLQKSPTP